MCDGHSDVEVALPDGRVIGVDGCIADLVRVLNNNGYETVASCCGHDDMPATIPLADGRWLVIAKDRADGERMTDLFAWRWLAGRVSALEAATGVPHAADPAPTDTDYHPTHRAGECDTCDARRRPDDDNDRLIAEAAAEQLRRQTADPALDMPGPDTTDGDSDG